ncbi:tRNA lysidine(34) synthetase TilS [Paenibacillus silviterrae]|uniref:tRNA lysidine(34) synthetase TilS n=1 Tax=Paenibacillus silviterrae TaxID=3242194 RepID=UPI002543668E|nr:tRNA lysidine(34) synthetase TilS [Paenibacillus chinjuensis]
MDTKGTLMMESDLAVRIEQHISSERFFERGESIVVAVSGGPDSVALLHLLFVLAPRWELRIVAAHVNHGFRGEESDREALFVERLCDEWGMPCEIGTIRVPSYIEETGENAQVAARELRYAFLSEVAGRNHATRIALAHHADDQAETLLMRIVRGTSPSGLGGIPARRKLREGLELVRPLLRIYKEEILRYCEAHGLSYCIDSSNLEQKYARNQFRLSVLPYLRQYNGNLEEALVRLAEVAAAENEYMDQKVFSLYKQYVRAENGFYSWSAKWFADVPLALQRRLIKLILSYLSAGPDSIDFLNVERIRTDVLRRAPSNYRYPVAQNIVLTREYDRVLIHRMVVPPSPYAYPLQWGQTELDIPEAEIRLHCVWMETGRLEGSSANHMTAFFDADALSFPLTVRSRQPGDRMRVAGLNGSKKVKDMFIDSKIPPSVRERIPMITDASGELIWVPGVRRSAAAAVTEQSRCVLRMMLLMPGGLNS